MDLTWYNSLNKPFFNPPSWVFGPAWTILYSLIAISAYLIWRKGFKKKQVKEALKVFTVQLVLNLSWSPIFFGARNSFLALIVIVLMLIYIVKTIKVFAKIDKTASHLLYPYIAWVSFATILNFSIWILNK